VRSSSIYVFKYEKNRWFCEGQPLNAGKITEIGGLDRKEVDKAMTKLKKEGKIVSPKRCCWEAA
jgi:hypothetical protein